MNTYIDKGVGAYVVYGSRDFSRPMWTSTSVWYVPGTWKEDE